MDSHPAVRLPRNSVFRSLAGRAAYDAYYGRVVERLPFPVREVDLPTRFGRTHVTIGGREDGPPLLVLPGMSICGPVMLEFAAPHAGDRLLIAPDLIGQPGRSEDILHLPRSHGYGLWLADLLDGLKIDRADMFSGSFGSSVALDLAAAAPTRAGRQVLLMPAGLTPKIPYLAIYWHLLLPWLLYRAFPDRAKLPAMSRPLAGSAFGPKELEYLDHVVRETAFWRHLPAGPFGPGDFRDYREPVFLATAGRDLLFPRGPTRANALASLNVTEEVFLPDSAHVPDTAAMAPVHDRIAAFLRA